MSQPRTILIAEDNQDDLLFLKEAFVRARIEHRLQFVADGEQAVAHLLGVAPYNDRCAHPLPDLVMLDVTLRPRNGFEILELMKSAASLRHIPVCILGGYDRVGNRERAASLRACCYHVKRRSRSAWDRILREVCAYFLDQCTKGQRR